MQNYCDQKLKQTATATVAAKSEVSCIEGISMTIF